MRRQTLSSALILLLLGVALAGCKPGSSPGADPASNPPGPTGPVVSDPAPGSCSPGTTAMDLPSGPYGGGITLKPPEPAGTAERPWLGYLSVDQMEVREGGGGILGTVYMRKGGTATVDVGAFWLRGTLMPAPSDAWLEGNLVLEGVRPADFQYSGMGDSGMFNLRIPPGKPGDSFRLTMKGVLLGDGTSGDVTVTFCRQSPPRAAVTYQAGDGWQPVAANVPAEGPLKLRVTFTAEMFPDTVERALKGPHDKEGRSQGDWITGLVWLDEKSLELTAEKTAPVMHLNMGGAQAKSGLFVTGGLPNLYAGEPPRVMAADPVSGQSAALAVLPPEPRWASLDPSGKRLRVTSQQGRRDSGGPTWQHLLVDLATGKAQAIKPEEYQGLWLPTGERISIRREGKESLLLVREGPAGRQETQITGLPAYDSFILSPDGQWVAVLTRTGKEAPYPYVGVRFLIVSSDGKERKPLDGEARMYRPGKDGVNWYGPAWSPDSTRIALTQTDEAGATSLVVADVAGGALRTITSSLPGSRGSSDPVLWSPDGAKILVGPLLLDAATGQVERRIEGIEQMPFWSPDGQWLLLQAGEWGEITAYNLATSQRSSLGEGMALGWSPEGKAILIRWPNAAHREVWGY